MGSNLRKNFSKSSETMVFVKWQSISGEDIGSFRGVVVGSSPFGGLPSVGTRRDKDHQLELEERERERERRMKFEF